MKGRILTIIVVLLAILMLALAHRRPVQDSDIVRAEVGVVVIQTANPYRFDVRLEVKCDWDWQKKAYRFHQFIVVPGKQQTLIRVPNSLKLCEIWPKVLW